MLLRRAASTLLPSSPVFHKVWRWRFVPPVILLVRSLERFRLEATCRRNSTRRRFVGFPRRSWLVGAATNGTHRKTGRPTRRGSAKPASISRSLALKEVTNGVLR